MSKGYSVFARGRKLYVKIKDVQGRWIQKRTGFSVGQEAEAERWSREFARRIEAERKAGASGPLTVADPTASGGDFHSPRNAAGERPSASLTAAELDGLVRSIREQLAPPAAVPPIAEADVALAGDTLSPPAHVPNHPLDRDRGAPGRLTIDPGEDGYKLVCEDGVVLARSRSTVACERIVAALRAHPQAPAPAPGSRPPGVPPRDPAAPLHPMAEDPATDVLTSATSPPVDREGLARIACGKAVDGALGEIARQCGRSAMLAEARTSGMLAAAPFLARLAPRPVAAFDLPAIEWSSDDTPRFFQAGNDVSGWVTDDGWALHLRGAATSEPEARAAVERLHAIATGQAVAARTLTNDDAVAIAIARPREHITVDTVIKAVASYYGVKAADLKSPRRHRSIAGPRAIAMYLARQHTKDSYPDLGRAFGGKHHTTVISAVEKIVDRLKNDGGLRGELHAIEATLLR